MLPVLIHPAGKLVTWCRRLTFKICNFFPPIGSIFCSQINIIQLKRKKLQYFQYKWCQRIQHKSPTKRTTHHPQNTQLPLKKNKRNWQRRLQYVEIYRKSPIHHKNTAASFLAISQPVISCSFQSQLKPCKKNFCKTNSSQFNSTGRTVSSSA